MNAPHSDALVFFGATGDLAYKKIFPSLQAMVKRGHLDVPVIGVAKAGWNLDQLKARAKDSLEKHGGLDPTAFEKLCGLLRYVDGDYDDPATFAALRKRARRRRSIRRTTWRSRRCCSARSSSSSPRPSCAKGARVIVEKPFGTDLASARKLNAILLGAFDESSIFRIDHYLGKRPVHNMLFFRFANSLPRAVLEPRTRRERADHDGGGLRRPGPRRLLRRDRRDPRRDAEPPVPGAREPGDGAAGAHRQRVDPRREGQGAEGDPGAGGEGRRARAVPRLPRRAGRGRRLDARRPSRRCGSRSIRGAGRACRSTSARASACR